MPTIDPKRLSEWTSAVTVHSTGNGLGTEALEHFGPVAIPALLAEREEMLALLRSLECGAENTCPSCRATVSRGGHENDTLGEHMPDCLLAAMLRG